jgi:hypothetical protein
MHYSATCAATPTQPPTATSRASNFWLEILSRTGDYNSTTRVFIESGEYKDRRD